MLSRLALILVLVTLTTQAAAEEPALGPVIEGYGPTYLIEDRDVPLREGFVYRTVFDLAEYRGEVTDLNPRIVSVARFLNMHARNGEKPDQMDLAMVVHGAALKNFLNHDAYKSRYGVDNPNLDLIGKLHDAGVKIYVCGQSMTFNGVSKAELVQSARVGLSAMTLLTVLQSDGYSLLP